MKDEIISFHNQVTDLQSQIDGLRARNTVLEQQLEDMEMSQMDKMGRWGPALRNQTRDDQVSPRLPGPTAH